MVRVPMVLLAFVLAAPLAPAQLKAPSPQTQKEPTLKAGDPAPPLAVTKWLTGDGVKGLKPDLVYVLHFHGPFYTDGYSGRGLSGCDPLSDLHDEFAVKGLVVLGVISSQARRPGVKGDDEETERRRRDDLLTAMTAQAKSVPYPFAWDDQQQLWAAYLGARPEKGEVRDAPPALMHPGSTVVIDRQGKVAYIGKPGLAAYVAEEVLEGRWKGKAGLDAALAAWAEFQTGREKKITGLGRPDEQEMKALRELDVPAMEAVFKKHPVLLADEDVQLTRFGLLVQAERVEDVSKLVDARIKTATKRNSLDGLRQLTAPFYYNLNRTPSADMAKVVAKLTDAIDKLNSVADKPDPNTFLSLIGLNARYGNTEKVGVYTKKTLDAVPEQQRREWEGRIENQLRPNLMVGDPAPPLAVSRWLNGQEVKGFEKGNVYVVCFHDNGLEGIGDGPGGRGALTAADLSDLHDRLAGKVVVVGLLSSRVAKPTEKQLAEGQEQLAARVKRSGATYPIGWDAEGKMKKAYGHLADNYGQSVVVIDQTGKIAWSDRDALTAGYIAEKIADGSWKGLPDLQAIQNAQGKYSEFQSEWQSALEGSLFAEGKVTEKGMKVLQEELIPALEKVIKDHPLLLKVGGDRFGGGSGGPFGSVQTTRLTFHLFAESYQVPEQILVGLAKRAVRQKNPYILYETAELLARIPFKGTPGMQKLIGKVCEELEPLASGVDPNPENGLSWVHLVAITAIYGNGDKVQVYTQKAVESVPEDKRKDTQKMIDRLLESVKQYRR